MKLKLLAAAAVLATAMPANATLLVNGSFDSGIDGWSRGRIGNPTFTLSQTVSFSTLMHLWPRFGQARKTSSLFSRTWQQ